MENEIWTAFQQGRSTGSDAFKRAPHLPEWQGKAPPGREPPEGWAFESAYASGYTAYDTDDARTAAPTGAWIAGYLEGWRAAYEAAQ